MDQKPADEGVKPTEQPVPESTDAVEGVPEQEEAQPDGQAGKFAGYDLTETAAATNKKPSTKEPAEVAWEASEYIHHERGVLWFVALGGITIGLGAFAIWLKAWTFLALVVFMTVALFVYTHRPPRTIKYHLSLDSLNIDGKDYHYGDFKAFGIQHDGTFYSIVLIPTKRFMPALHMFFDEKDGEHIVDILGAHLPMQEMEPDMLDMIFKKLRF